MGNEQIVDVDKMAIAQIVDKVLKEMYLYRSSENQKLLGYRREDCVRYLFLPDEEPEVVYQLKLCRKNTLCIICRSVFREDRIVVFFENCRHLLHFRCFSQWRDSQEELNLPVTCPLDKEVLKEWGCFPYLRHSEMEPPDSPSDSAFTVPSFASFCAACSRGYGMGEVVRYVGPCECFYHTRCFDAFFPLDDDPVNFCFHGDYSGCGKPVAFHHRKEIMDYQIDYESWMHYNFCASNGFFLLKNVVDEGERAVHEEEVEEDNKIEKNEDGESEEESDEDDSVEEEEEEEGQF